MRCSYTEDEGMDGLSNDPATTVPEQGVWQELPAIPTTYDRRRRLQTEPGAAHLRTAVQLANPCDVRGGLHSTTDRRPYAQRQVA